MEPKPTGLSRRDFLKVAASTVAVAAGGFFTGKEIGANAAASEFLDPTKEWATSDKVAPAGLISRLGLGNTHEILHAGSRITRRNDGKIVSRTEPNAVLFDPNYDQLHYYHLDSVALSPNGRIIVVGVEETGREFSVDLKSDLNRKPIENRIPREIQPDKESGKFYLVAPLKETADNYPPFVLKFPKTKAICFDGKSRVYVIGGEDNDQIVYQNDRKDLLKLWRRPNNPITVSVYGEEDLSGKVYLSPEPSKRFVLNDIHRLNSKFSKRLLLALTGTEQDAEALEINANFKSVFPDVVAVTTDGRHIALSAYLSSRSTGKNYSAEGVLVLDPKNQDRAFPVLASDFPGGTNDRTNDRKTVEVVGTHDNNIVVMHTKNLRPVELGLVVLNTGDDRHRLIPIQIPNGVTQVEQYDTGFVAEFYDGNKRQKWLLPLAELTNIQAGTVKPENTRPLWKKME